MTIRSGLVVPIILSLIVPWLAVGCGRGSNKTPATVVLYTSVDEPYVRPLVQQFEQETGIHVTLLTDAEASKSVGLAERIRAEKDHPVADVWWDNECFLTVRLADEGVLAPYDSPSAADIPPQYKEANHLWAGSVLRVRVIVSASTLPGPAPRRLQDLARADLKDKVAMARPTAGTTGGHIAVLYGQWGSDRAQAFLHELRDNGIKLVGGNSIVAESVARGDFLAGLCDNDDAAAANADVGKLNVSLPDQGDGEQGTLTMPCAVALVAGAPHRAEAQRLIDFLLSARVDKALIDAKFAWCSARNTAGKGKFMEVDYHKTAQEMPAAIRDAVNILDAR